jgi:hypothetical protein
VDKEAETPSEEQTLRGVRKAQLKLAAFYLSRGAERPGAHHLPGHGPRAPARLASLQSELLGDRAKDFWEVTDRGINFDYLDDARKAQLRSSSRGSPREPREAVNSPSGLFWSKLCAASA